FVLGLRPLKYLSRHLSALLGVKTKRRDTIRVVSISLTVRTTSRRFFAVQLRASRPKGCAVVPIQLSTSYHRLRRLASTARVFYRAVGVLTYGCSLVYAHVNIRAYAPRGWRANMLRARAPRPRA